MRTKITDKTAIGVILVWLTVALTMIASWVTHVIVSIKTASWVLLIIGIIVPPIGWVHGFGVWFGAF